MENEERIIKKTSSGWKAILGKQRGSLILTNRRLIIGDSSNSIPLEDIIDVDIETRLADVTQIQIECKDGTKYLEFVRRGGNHVAQILLGNSGWSFSEVSSYTSYWASILTIAIFLFGQAGEMRDEKYEDKN